MIFFYRYRSIAFFVHTNELHFDSFPFILPISFSLCVSVVVICLEKNLLSPETIYFDATIGRWWSILSGITLNVQHLFLRHFHLQSPSFPNGVSIQILIGDVVGWSTKRKHFWENLKPSELLSTFETNTYN